MRAALRAVLFGPSLLSRVLSIPGLSALYDPSDLTSIYQSRTGGSTGAVDSVVGIMLDKHLMGGKTAANFIAGQSELVSNGTFDSATTGWTAGNATLSVDANRLLVTGGVGGNGYAYQAITTVANRWYIATFDTTFGTETNALFRAGTSIGGAELVQITWTVAGAKAVLFMATGTTSYLRIGQNNPSTGLTVYFDNVSVKAIPGYHALAPSDAARPILRAGPYIDFDGVDDVLNAVIGANLGASCSVYHRTQAGAHVWLDAQTINSGNYAMSTTDWRKAAIFSSLPTGTEKAIVEAWGAAA